MRKQRGPASRRGDRESDPSMRKLILALVLCHPLHWALVAGAIQVWPEAPLPVILPANLTAPEQDPGLLWMEMDADLLADVALGEDRAALAAVMWVVLNRREANEALETTIQDGQAFGSMKGGRFRPSWHRTPGRRWARFYPGAWAEAQETAWNVLLGLRSDPTGGADHFHRRGTWRPPWAPTEVSWVLVGSHHFYKGEA